MGCWIDGLTSQPAFGHRLSSVPWHMGSGDMATRSIKVHKLRKQQRWRLPSAVMESEKSQLSTLRRTGYRQVTSHSHTQEEGIAHRHGYVRVGIVVSLVSCLPWPIFDDQIQKLFAFFFLNLILFFEFFLVESVV